MDVAVQQVVADVGGGSLHALDKDLPFGHVEVVVQEGPAVGGLPEELLGDVAPELCATGRSRGQNQTLTPGIPRRSAATFNTVTLYLRRCRGR